MNTGTKLGRYEIRSKLGAGGMGEVYLAQDTTELGRTVAVKVLSAEVASDPKRMQRFVQEAKTVSALNHPNILTIYEFGQDDATRFIASEFVDGVTLREYMRARSLKLHEVLDIAAQVAAALDAAHEAHVAHRDIKPENVMVRRRDTIVKVLDFGLAKLSEPPSVAGGPTGSEDATRVQMNTEPGVVMGTVSYMSPEQTRGLSTIDQRTDIWSLGAVLYELVAGRVPFEGKDVHRQIIAIQEQDAPPLSRFATGVPERLEDIVAKALAKDPDERYQTAKDMLIDLRNLKRKLEVDAEIDRTISPDVRAASTASGQSNLATVSGTVPPTALPSVPSAVSSAAYVVSGIKQHNLAAVAVVAVLVMGALAFFLFLRGRTNTTAIQSIAVMPFVNESGNADVEYLTDGMTETLIKSLSSLPDMDVKPRSAVFRYKGKDTDLQTIGKQLGVQAILSGRVVQRGDQLNLSLELVDVQKNRVIWSELYNRTQSDLVSLQSEIAKDVSTKLTAKLSGAQETKITRTGTADPQAYQAYLKGRFYWNRRTGENLKKAIEQFKVATDRDPNYALAYVGLADCYALLNEYAGTPVAETAPQTKMYAERAIALDGSLAEPHATLGTIDRQLGQWIEAEKEFKRAIELNPNYATAYHWYAVTLIYLGRKDESLAMIQRAHEIDPLSSVITSTLSWIQLSRNNPQASIENELKVIELDPNFGLSFDTLGLSYLKTGRHAEAIAACEKAAQLTNRYGEVLGDLGYVYAQTGKRPEALAIIKELEDKYARKETEGSAVAAVYAGLGDKDKAFEWLEKDLQNRSGNLPDVAASFPFDSLRGDSRYKDLVRRMNLPE